MDERKKKQAPSSDAVTVTKLALAVAGIIVSSLMTTTAQAEECVPSCRDGYICHQGQCITACNPPCAEGEQCIGEGQCVAAVSSAGAQQTTYTPVDTSGGSVASVDSGSKPSTAIPATFVGLGGLFLIAGGVSFATGEWDGYYGDYWGTGQWVGVVLMTWGAISIATATPFLVRQVKAKRRWEREHARALARDLAVAPILLPAPRNGTYGLTLHGRF
jgi:hypothetical protein